MSDKKTSQFGTITAIQANTAGTEGYIPYVDPSQVDPDLRNKRMTRSEAKKFFGLDPFTALSGTSWDGSNKTLILTANTTLTFSSTKRNGILRVKQDGTGSRTLSINGVSVPVSTGANTITVISFFYDDVAGLYVFSYDTNILGNVGGGLITLNTPGSFAATSGGSGVINLNWTDTNTSPNETAYKIYFNGVNDFGTAGVLTTTAANATSYSHTGLTPGAPFYYWIKAVGDGSTTLDSSTASSNATAGSGGGSYDTDAQAIIDAKTTAGVSWSTTKQDGVNTFVLALKSASIWTKGRQFGNLSDGSFAKNKINWKSPGTKDLSSETGGITYGANGTTGNGSTGYINTGIIPDTEYGAGGAPGFSNSAFALYCRTSGSTDVTFDFGCGINAPASQIVLTAGWGTARGVIDAGDQVNVATDSQGFFAVSRTSSTSLKLYKNGSQIGSTNTTDVAGIDNLPTNSLYLLAFNDNGAAALFSQRENSFWWIGDALNDSEVSALNTAFQNLKTAFGW